MEALVSTLASQVVSSAFSGMMGKGAGPKGAAAQTRAAPPKAIPRGEGGGGRTAGQRAAAIAPLGARRRTALTETGTGKLG